MIKVQVVIDAFLIARFLQIKLPYLSSFSVSVFLVASNSKSGIIKIGAVLVKDNANGTIGLGSISRPVKQTQCSSPLQRFFGAVFAQALSWGD